MKQIIIALFAAIFFMGCDQPEKVYSEGARVGTVQKLSLKGDYEYRKTYEGILLQNGALGAWEFSISPMDQVTAQAAQSAADNQTPVKLHYKQYKGTAPEGAPTFQTEYRVYKVEVLTTK